MSVAYFQIAIIASIVAAYLIVYQTKKVIMHAIRAAFALSILWSLWTTIMVFTPPLRIVQLLFIWTTMFALWYISRHKITIGKLRDKLVDYEDDSIAAISRIIENKRVDVIVGEKHREILRNTLDSAKETIYILSGWANTYVINDEFKSKLAKALERGVNIYLGFGYSLASKRRDLNEKEIEAREILTRAADWAETKSKAGKLYFTDYPNHSKILICDEMYTICGSCNWLSNDGFSNEEHSYKITDVNFIKTEQNRISSIIFNNLIKEKKDIISKLNTEVRDEAKARNNAEIELNRLKETVQRVSD